ncbi:MAG TPA: hypothetical protein VMV86_04265, partial [Methanosarcinales archaeon]|nr:hypothetical protein [Methanosarcinales archaeon]
AVEVTSAVEATQVTIKVNMCDWYRNTKRLPAWFKHGEVADITWQQLQELHNAGISIMLRHFNKDGISLLGVSNSGFGQR